MFSSYMFDDFTVTLKIVYFNLCNYKYQKVPLIFTVKYKFSHIIFLIKTKL
jgi:hypothetical protein